MDLNPTAVYSGAALFFLLTVLALLVLRLRRRGYYPYAAKHILTKREYKFYLLLRRIAEEEDCLICPKVGVKDLLAVTDRRNYMKYFHKIAQKHIDFVICDRDLRVLFALELDDSSHETRDARRRDAFKNKAFAAAGIPLKRITAIDERQIRMLFQDIR